MPSLVLLVGSPIHRKLSPLVYVFLGASGILKNGDHWIGTLLVLFPFTVGFSSPLEEKVGASSEMAEGYCQG